MTSTNNSGKRIGLRRYRTRLRPVAGRPDLTPLVDVLFLALIFFMISSSFVRVSGIKVDLPQVNASTVADIEKFIISVAWSENESLIYFNDQQVSWEMLKEKLAEVSGMSKAATVVIRADSRIPFETVAQVMAMAERAGLASFIAVMPQKMKPDAVFNP